MKCFILRGVPGCGKSTWANDSRRFHPVVPTIISADDYFNKIAMTENKSYEQVFNPAFLPNAHNHAYLNFIKAINEFKPIVIVDNTNIRAFELAPYYRYAEVMTYEVQIVQFICNPKVAGVRNKHGVPMQKVVEMYNSIEPLPPWWKTEYVLTQ